MSLLEVSDGAVRHIPRQRDRRPLWPAARLRGEGTAARRAWRSRYVRRLVALDVASAIAAGVLGQIAETQPVSGSMNLLGSLLTVLVVFPLLWAGAMLVARAYEERFLWIGAEEFRRVFFAADACWS